MARAKHPLVPLELFRSRNFAITNLSTFLIYGALYVILYFLTLFMQGVLGYSAAAAGVAGMPATLLLVFFSSRAGALSARFGPRAFMVAGPLIMSVGVLTFAFVPADATAWRLGQGDTFPPADYFTRILPGLLIFGVGITMLVTPLVTALMSSVPVRNSGLASAINNAISRVGPQLVGALLFIAISATFYAGLQTRVSGIDVSSAEIRREISPLNPPRAEAFGSRASEVAAAARSASTDSFHLAMFTAAALLVAGAIVNLGIRNQPAPQPSEVAAAAG
jgi:predicted MFS family arabinose efflux permease